MSTWNRRHRDEYLTLGFTIFRGAIPPALIEDLRREADKAREIARQEGGPQRQRLQPVYRYPELDVNPFRQFLALPILERAVREILGPDHGPSEIMGVLLEPGERPWCTNWHRDWRDHDLPVPQDEFVEAQRKPGMFNQLNAALYDDHSLWVVPGSHAREDTSQEQVAFGRVPTPLPVLTDAMSNAERERACQEYAARMPDAVQIHLAAGDVAFYRACGWHIGVYVPYARRATLHDGYYGPDDYAWQERMRTAGLKVES